MVEVISRYLLATATSNKQAGHLHPSSSHFSYLWVWFSGASCRYIGRVQYLFNVLVRKEYVVSSYAGTAPRITLTFPSHCKLDGIVEYWCVWSCLIKHNLEQVLLNIVDAEN